MLESLATIKKDLESTAIHMEKLSNQLADYCVFNSKIQRRIVPAIIDQNLQGIARSIDVLRAAAYNIHSSSD